MISAYALFAIPIAAPITNDADRKLRATDTSRRAATATLEVRVAIVTAATAMMTYWRRRDRTTTSGDSMLPATKPMLNTGNSRLAAQKMPFSASRYGNTDDTFAS